MMLAAFDFQFMRMTFKRRRRRDGPCAPAWLFSRSVLESATSRDVASQLPWPYRMFLTYCREYFRRRPEARGIPNGAQLLSLAQRVWRWHRGSAYVTLTIGGVAACLFLPDPRFLQVIAEVRRQAPSRLLAGILKPEDIFIDVGANQGGFSIVASQLVGRRGRVIAIEPQPALAEAIRRSLRVGPAPSMVHAVALSDSDGSTTLYVPRAYSGMASVAQGFAAVCGDAEALMVPSCSLDSLFGSEALSGRVVLKIDAEGSEVRLLEGARRFIHRYRPVMMIEVNPQALRAAGTTVSDLVNLLKAAGYPQYRRDPYDTDGTPVDDLTHTDFADVILIPT